MTQNPLTRLQQAQVAIHDLGTRSEKMTAKQIIKELKRRGFTVEEIAEAAETFK